MGIAVAIAGVLIMLDYDLKNIVSDPKTGQHIPTGEVWKSATDFLKDHNLNYSDGSEDNSENYKRQKREKRF